MSHLNLATRSEIENGLRHGDGCGAIARRLNVSRTTVVREIQKHAVDSDKGAKGRVTNRCIHSSECTRHFLCQSCSRPLQNRRCSLCTHCNEVCPDFEEIVCQSLSRPPYVCNGCTREGICVLRKRFYVAKVAQEEYEKVLSSAREGAAVTDEERRQMSDTLAAGFRKGQPLHHIAKSAPDLFHVSERTLYTYVNSGIPMPVGRTELPVAPKMKPRRKKGVEHKVDRKCREGRTREDFLKFMEDNPGMEFVEMDSVEGERGGKVLLTLNLNVCTFMMLFIRDANTSQTVIDVFNMLEQTLSFEVFTKLFPVILTDNGHEFPPPERSNLTEHASSEGVLSGEVRDEHYDVHNVYYEPHVKRNAEPGTPRTMRVDYEVAPTQYKSEWVCPEHTGYARSKFERWWRERACPDCPVPNTVDEAVAWANAGALAVPKGIVVRWVTGEKFDRIVKVECGDRPEMTDELMFAIESGPLTTPSGGCPENLDDDELPF